MSERTITIYCPHGHNVLVVPENRPYDECGACGAKMSADAAEDFDNAVEYSFYLRSTESNNQPKE